VNGPGPCHGRVPSRPRPAGGPVPHVASLLAGALALGLQVVAAGPVPAATATVQFTSPAPNQALTASAFELRIRVSTGSGTLRDKVFVDVTSPQGRPGASFEEPTHDRPAIDVVRTLTLGWNGPYQTRVRAAAKSGTFDDDTGHKTYTSSFTVDAPPAVPTGVTARADRQTRVVTVSWAANTEPDTVGYEVEKQSSSGRWASFAVTDATSVTDESTANAGGTYRYQVRALRQSAQPGQLNPSGYSAPAGTTVPAPPEQTTPTTTTTTTLPDGSGSGEEETTPGGDDDDGGSSGPSGSRGSSGGSRSFDGARSGGPLLGSGDKVNLSDFQALLKQAQVQAGAPAPAPEDEGTYDERLPFKARSEEGEADDDDDPGEEALGEAPATQRTDTGALGFLAGGLLATVLAMHVLWVRSEVRRAEELEALIPAVVDEAPPAGRRRRRPSPVAR
jgi:hypothetical protein